MNHLLKHYGYDAAQAFQDRIQNSIASKTQGNMIPLKELLIILKEISNEDS